MVVDVWCGQIGLVASHRSGEGHRPALSARRLGARMEEAMGKPGVAAGSGARLAIRQARARRQGAQGHGMASWAARLWAAGVLAGAQPATAGVLDDLVKGYQAASSSWLGTLVPMAERTF